MALAKQAAERGGSALDMVEAGGRVAEADESNSSVGLGGLPDRGLVLGVTVVALTDHAVSPLAKAATLRFELGDNLSLPFRSLAGPMCAAQALVLAVGYAQAERPSRKGSRRAPAKSA